ncbi:MAG: protoporphyrinogen oxidase [Luteitalea sp.]|nr:protoporphyrinogen oxidase [Luteitalea sp.]
MSVVIVGGGMAGLATAFELHARKIPFVLLDGAERAGGIVISEQIDGYTIDGGPDALLVQKPDGIRLCEEVGLGERLIPTSPPRIAFVQRNGCLHPLPATSVLGIPTRLGPFAATRLFSWRGKLRMAGELFVPAKRDDADESIGAFMRRRFGVEATTYLAEPLLAGIHAGDVDALSVQALFPRLVEAERQHGSLLRAFRRQPPSPAAAEGAFRSLPGGLSELVTALVAAMPRRSIRLRTPVDRVRCDRSDGFRVETHSGELIRARALVLCTPAYVTSQILREAAVDLAQLCAEVRYASTATVALAFTRGQVDHPLNGSGFVVPRVERSGILAASWLSSKWSHRAPADRVLLRTFVGGARDPAALDRADAELVTLSRQALEPLLRITGAPLLTRVYRWVRASAQHEVGHLARMAAIDRALERHPGLFVTGSGFRGVGIPDCIADGRSTASQVSSWLSSSVSA